MSKPCLPVHEWLLAALLVSLFIVLAAKAASSKETLPAIKAPHHPLSDTIEVYVEGAVVRPGVYRMKRGDRLQALLDQASPLAEADVSRLKKLSRLRDGQTVKVRTKPLIRIEVKGAVQEEGEYWIPRGTRLSDLKEWVELTEEADEDRLNKRRFLKEGETLYVYRKEKE